MGWVKGAERGKRAAKAARAIRAKRAARNLFSVLKKTAARSVLLIFVMSLLEQVF